MFNFKKWFKELSQKKVTIPKVPVLVDPFVGPPEPFLRFCKPVPGYPGWFFHDGGTCPVKPDTVITMGSGTYYSPNGMFTFKAKSTEWENIKIPNLRDEIQTFGVVQLMPNKSDE